jgi:CheY-like chemotaxis protein
LKTQAPAILLIEKDDITLELYQRELSKSFTVFAFTDTNRVLKTVANQEIQAVIIEPEIESGHGWDLIHLIHTTFPDRHIPVIVCSTNDPGHTEYAKEITKHLTKPVLPLTLKEETLEVLGMNGKKRKNT